MTRDRFRATVRVPVPVETLFAWHEAPGAFLRLSPPWDRPRILSHTGGIQDGARVELSVPAGPVSTHWLIEHRDYLRNARFRDVMLKGPFAHWVHTHEFESDGAYASRLTDAIDYALPMGAAGELAGGWLARNMLRRVFAYRHQLLLADLERHAPFRDRAPLTIAITGATGMIGSQLAAFLSTGGHTVIRLGRGRVEPGVVDVPWDPARGVLDPHALERVDAVINLAGAPIAERWNAGRRRAILDSRVQATTLLAHTMAQLAGKPRALLSGSAIGFYGSQGDIALDEGSAGGEGFLADVVKNWEASTDAAARAGIRVVHFRTGIVQCAAGGALARQLPLFSAGIGGRLGRDGSWVSPIALDDVIGAMHFALMHDELSGALNLVGPSPVTNADYARILARVLRRPAFFSVPDMALKLVLGTEMARQTVLSSQRVLPRALERAGFRFRHPTLDAMLRFELGEVDETVLQQADLAH